MHKPWDNPLKRPTNRLMELNNYLFIFFGYSATKKTPPEDLNKILLYAVLNGRANQAYLKGWEFEMKI